MFDTDKARETLTRIESRAGHERFFQKIRRPEWLPILREEGYLKRPPSAQRVANGIRFPSWSETQYLLRVVEQVPDAVAQTLMTMEDTDNHRVIGELVDVVCKLPADSATEWAGRHLAWLQSQDYLYAGLEYKYAGLVSYLVEQGAPDAGLQIMSTLLDLRSAHSSDEDDAQPVSTRDPQTRLDDWSYQKLLREQAQQLATVKPVDTLEFLSTLLRHAIHISFPTLKNTSEDWSHVWRPSIQKHEQNHGWDIKEHLVCAIHDIARQISADGDEQARHITEHLMQQDKKVFWRTGMALMCEFSDATPDLIQQTLSRRDLFDDTTVRHEYYNLQQDCFGQLRAELQTVVIKWAMHGPNMDKVRGAHEISSRQPMTPEQERTYAANWTLHRLHPLRHYLRGESQARYDELASEYGDPDHPEFPYFSTSWTGPQSPLARHEVESMDPKELIDYLRAWEPTERPDAPSPEGLGRDLQEQVANFPGEYASSAKEFIDLQATYVRNLLGGLERAVANGSQLDWDPVIGLAEWVLQQPVLRGDLRVSVGDHDPDWSWTRKSIASLLDAALKSNDKAGLIPLRQRIWSILETLARDADPSIDDADTNEWDIRNVAINSTRGTAMHGVFSYMHWVCTVCHNAEQPWQGLQDVAEAKCLLEERLNPDSEPASAIRAIYGERFPLLLFLDNSWAKQHKNRIFAHNPDEAHLGTAAWNAYILSNTWRPEQFAILRQEYRNAVRQLSDTPQEESRGQHLPTTLLAQHLMIACWAGAVGTGNENSILREFFERASPQIRSEALQFVGRTLWRMEEPPPPPALQRLRDLWSWRLSTLSLPEYHREDKEELKSFAWWFISRKFEPRWACEQLTLAIANAKGIEAESQVVKYLEELAPTMPNTTIDALDALIKNTEPTTLYLVRSHFRSIIRYAIASDAGTQHKARQVIDRLLERGFSDLYDSNGDT